MFLFILLLLYTLFPVPIQAEKLYKALPCYEKDYWKNRLQKIRESQDNLTSSEEKDNKKEAIFINNKNPKLGLFVTIQEFVKKNKNEIIIGSTIFTAYQLFCLRLYYAKSYVTKTTTWGSFNKNIPIDSLYEIPQEKFLADLEMIIYRTFSEDENNPNYENTESLSLFIKAAQKEIKQLEKFVNLYWYCTIPLISFLFPDYDDELILAQEKIERLNYMIELVTKKLYELHS